MRRDKESLAFWLAGTGKSKGPGVKSRFLRIDASVENVGLGIVAGAVSPGDTLQLAVRVHDGMSGLESLAHTPSRERVAADSVPVHEIDLCGAAVVRSLDPAEPCRVRVRHAALIERPVSRTISVKSWHVAVRGIRAMSATEVHEGAKLLLPIVGVRNWDKAGELPHRIESVALDRVPESERRAFLREAAALKYVTAERAELVAVFRRLPIEMISRLRFVASEKALLYDLAVGNAKRTCTRLHDLAAVRDPGSGEVHLIPNRTRFTPVVLK
ncbi:MAG: hypothetical protein GXX84_16625 [Acidobacteria bacterium]|nr:hypothetical protein [Acidobacteriota bacterium]